MKPIITLGILFVKRGRMGSGKHYSWLHYSLRRVLEVAAVAWPVMQLLTTVTREWRQQLVFHSTSLPSACSSVTLDTVWLPPLIFVASGTLLVTLTGNLLHRPLEADVHFIRVHHCACLVLFTFYKHADYKPHVALVLICVTLALEPLAGKNPLPWNTGPVHFPGTHLLTSLKGRLNSWVGWVPTATARTSGPQICS